VVSGLAQDALRQVGPSPVAATRVRGKQVRGKRVGGKRVGVTRMRAADAPVPDALDELIARARDPKRGSSKLPRRKS
jgi:hypothetical protein